MSFAVSSFVQSDAFADGSGRNLGTKNPVYSGTWNWGAFFFQSLWLLNHRKFTLAIVHFAIFWIPLVGLGFGIYLGFKANDLAYDGRRFSSIEEFVAVQNAWRNWGFALTAISLFFVIVGRLVGASYVR
jgi:hypothetical protein